MTSLSKNELRKSLSEIFSILGFSDEQIDKAVQDFQKRIAFELLESVKNELSTEYREFIERTAKDAIDPRHPMVLTIKKELERLHSKEEYLEKSRTILNGLIHKYADYMSRGLSAETAYKLKIAADKIWS